VYIGGEFYGGCDIMLGAVSHCLAVLQQLRPESSFALAHSPEYLQAVIAAASLHQPATA
jgi:hypothetical protein